MTQSELSDKVSNGYWEQLMKEMAKWEILPERHIEEKIVMTEQDKFEEWFNKQGIIGFNVTINPDLDTSKFTSKEQAKEHIYKELNAINKAIESGEYTEFQDF
jgi:hypothetical protein